MLCITASTISDHRFSLLFKTEAGMFLIEREMIALAKMNHPDDIETGIKD